MHDEQPPCSLHTFNDRVFVEREQRSQIDDLDSDPVAFERPRGLDRFVNHGTIRDDGQVLAFQYGASLT